MSKPACTLCFHPLDQHGKTGKCTAHTTMEGMRGPDGRCLCRHPVARSMTKAQSVRKINREITAAYFAGRDTDSTHATRA